MRFSHLLGGAVLLLAACTANPPSDPPIPESTVPGWAADAVFYQIFPERFRNGDPSNDPTRASLEFPERAPATWAISPWTGDWYAQADWEKEMGDFYASVFHRRYGGDLQGVIDRLDYLRDLGINTLYFNPVFYARSMHKYDGNTFHHIDPYFGPDPEGDFALMAQETSDPATWQWTAADRLFLDLLRESHARGLRVVIDGVFNHTGRDFFAFADLRENQQDSPYTDWYIVEAYDDPATEADEFQYQGWWGVETLPEFADNADGTDLHPAPKQYIFDATVRWMDPDGDGDPSDGIDGWRLDVANMVPTGFWADWNAHVRSLNPAAYTVSEVWEDAADFLVAGGFSATMNYHGFAYPVKGFLVDGRLTASGFAAQLNERREEYPEAMQPALQNLIDSHDTDRLASMIANRDTYDAYLQPDRYDYDWGERVSPYHGYLTRAPNATDRQIQRLVLAFQMTYVGAPMIYYGTEAGMWGADDPDDRMPMVWRDRTYEDQALDPFGRARPVDPVRFEEDVFDAYQQWIALRHRYPALRHGSFEVTTTDDAAQTLGFVRAHEGQRLFVALNRSEASQTLSLPGPGSLVATTTDGATTTDAELTLPPLTAALVELAP